MKKKILDIAWWGRRILTAVLAGVIVLVASGQGQAADTYSESDVELIAKTVWQEARGIERKAEQAIEEHYEQEQFKREIRKMTERSWV